MITIGNAFILSRFNTRIVGSTFCLLVTPYSATFGIENRGCNNRFRISLPLFPPMSDRFMLIIIIILIAAFLVLGYIYRKKWKAFSYKVYKPIWPLLTQREKYLFEMIERMNLGKCFAKVRVADIITTNRREYRYSNKITQKHVDIVIVDDTYKPIIVIEIQDSSHYKSDRMTRDRFLKKVFSDAKIPLLFLWGSNHEKLRELITATLAQHHLK